MAGWTLSKMAESMGRCKGTISRELRRNKHEYMEVYDSYSVAGIISRRLSQARQPVKMNHTPLAEYVKKGLGQQWSRLD